MKVPATPRTLFGKGPSRRLRAAGQIPAVVYGCDRQAEELAVSPKVLVDVLESAWGRNSVIELDVESGSKQRVLLADFQYHPVTRRLLHADFLRISDDQCVDVEVPFETTGKAQGVVLGGTLSVVYRKLPLRCKPADIPERIVYDVTELEVDAHVSISDIALPEGVQARLPGAQTVISIVGGSSGRAADQAAEGEEEADGAADAAATK